MEIFKRRYLPMIIIAITLIFVVIIIAGAITRGIQRKEVATEASLAALAENAKQDEEAKQIAAQAGLLVANYDYDGAIALIDDFSGNLTNFPELAELRVEIVTARDNLVVWSDPSVIPNLSFNMLIEDAGRAYNDDEYASAFKKNYITTMEFSNILEQLYNNGCVLVSMDDIIDAKSDDNGSLIYSAKALSLPAGKTPIIITQTNVNYDLYMVDGDDDGYADKDGSGFANRLILDENGNITCEYVDASGNTQVGAYDLVPILDAFIAEHPDFSYQGAKAIIAVTGHEGLFGYRTRDAHRQTYGEEIYNQEVESAKAVAQALVNSGYELACYTYNNTAYGNRSIDEIKAEMNMWAQEVTPIIGQVDTFVFAQKSDISEEKEYSGDKYSALYSAGFRYFIGFCNDGLPWATVTNDYVHLGRILVGGSTITTNPEWYTGLFNPETVLDKTARGS